MSNDEFPDAIDADLVGTYPALAKAGGGYVWDDVLEYRVWCHPERGADDLEDGSDYYFAFATVEFLRRPRRTPNTIPDFMSPGAPANRLDIIRGLAPPIESK